MQRTATDNIAYIKQRVKPITGMYIDVELQATNDTGEVLRFEERRKKCTFADQWITARALLHDFIYEIEAEGYECVVK